MLRPCIGAAVGRITPKKFICVIVFLTGTALASNAEIIPVPRERPPVLEDQTSKIESERSPCQLRLSEIAEFKPEPPITGPGECTATDVVNVNAVLLPGNQRVIFSPVVTLQCSMAEVVSHWIRDDVAPTLDSLGMPFRGIETLESFGCRSFNGISGAKLSEHGHANALDVRSLKLANGTIIELTNATVSKSLREQLRQTACTRFSTVLGNGADAYHENHVHIDLMQRTNNYKICQWNILDPAEIAALAAKQSAVAAMPIPEATQSDDVPVPRAKASAARMNSDFDRSLDRVAVAKNGATGIRKAPLGSNKRSPSGTATQGRVVGQVRRPASSTPGTRLVRVACGHENESTTAPESAQGILQNKIAPTRSP